MSAEYEELVEGSFEDYEAAVASRDYALAWQYIVTLALDDPDKDRVERLCYSSLAIDDRRLVSGVLEALSILFRFRHRVDRSRLAQALDTILPHIRVDEDIVEELEWLAGWLELRSDSSAFKFDYGHSVRVVVTAPAELRPGAYGAVCGMIELEGERLYTVEYADGKSSEIPEGQLELDRLACLCCGNLTLAEEATDTHEICPVCFWEVDPVQSREPERAGGANAVSLIEARRNFREFGACERRLLEHVRAPRPEELPISARD